MICWFETLSASEKVTEKPSCVEKLHRVAHGNEAYSTVSEACLARTTDKRKPDQLAGAKAPLNKILPDKYHRW